MVQEKIVSAKNEESAKSRVALEFGVDADKLKCEMVKAAKKGILGFGSQDAEYKVSYDDGKPEPKKAPTAERVVEKKVEPVREVKPVKTDKYEKTEKTEKHCDCKKCEENIEAVISFIDMILADLKLDAKAKITSSDDEDIYIEIVGDNMGVIIGHHGEVLDAIQYLSNIVCDNEKADSRRIHVDVENYRSRREETLNKLADKMARKVLSTGKSITLEPMNPYERRIIHSYIQKIDGVTTRSVGTDLGRKVVISLDKGENKGGEKHEKADRNYKVERPEYSGQDGCYDRYTAPGR